MSKDKDPLEGLRETATLLEVAAARLEESATRLEQTVTQYLEENNHEHK